MHVLRSRLPTENRLLHNLEASLPFAWSIGWIMNGKPHILPYRVQCCRQQFFFNIFPFLFIRAHLHLPTRIRFREKVTSWGISTFSFLSFCGFSFNSFQFSTTTSILNFPASFLSRGGGGTRQSWRSRGRLHIMMLSAVLAHTAINEGKHKKAIQILTDIKILPLAWSSILYVTVELLFVLLMPK